MDELARLVDVSSNVRLIDVREDSEYEIGHVPGAVHIPLGHIVDRAGELLDGPWHMICRSGARSMKACEQLAPLGIDVTNVAGGTEGWIDAGYAVDQGAFEA